MNSVLEIYTWTFKNRIRIFTEINWKLNIFQKRKYLEERKRVLKIMFSNSLITHAALSQPEHRILVRWMGLETPMKNELKTWPCLKLYTDANVLNLHIDKERKTQCITINNLITHFTIYFQPKLFTAF